MIVVDKSRRPPPDNRRLQFSVGWLFGVTFMFAVPMAFIGHVMTVEDQVEGPTPVEREANLLSSWTPQDVTRETPINRLIEEALKYPGDDGLTGYEYLMRPGIKLEREVVGSGRVANRGDSVTVQYDLFLNRGDKVDSQRYTFTVGKREVIAGLEYGVEGMREGGQRRIRVSPHLAYRDVGVPEKIPPNALLVFDIELVKVESDK